MERLTLVGSGEEASSTRWRLRVQATRHHGRGKEW